MKIIFLLFLLETILLSKVYDLKEIYNLSTHHSESLQIAKYRQEISISELDKSKASFLPNIKIESELLKVNEFPVIVDGIEVEKRDKRKDVTLTIDQVLYDRSKYLDYKDKSTASLQSLLEKEKEKQQLIFDVTKYYFETIFKAKQIDLAIQKLRRLEKILERAKFKYKSGFISKADYLEVKAEKSELLTQKLQFKLDYLTSKSFLEKMVEVDNINIKKKIDLSNINIVSIDGFINEFENNLDLKIQKYKLKRAQIGKSISLSKFEPVFTLNYEQKSNDIPDSENQKKLTFLLSFNIFKGFYDFNSYEQARIQKIIEEKSLSKILKDIKQNIKNKIEKVRTFHEIILSYPETLEIKKFTLEGMRERFNIGTKSIIDLLDEENKYFEKLNKFTEYKYQFVIEYATLKQFTNSLDEDFINQINGFVYE